MAMGPPKHRTEHAKGGAAPEQATQRPLHICADCESILVYPTDWQATGTDRWTVTLRCPNCERTHEGAFEQDMVDAFDVELDDGMQTMLCALRELTRENLAEDIERFITALDADAILPMDF